jgi:PAS domain S-box-containing protein
MNHPRLDDPDRLAALRALELVDHDPGPAFERLARLARLLLAAPVAVVSLVDDRRQVVLGQAGLDVAPGARLAIPIEESVCAHVIVDGGELLVTDLRDHPVLGGIPGLARAGVVAYAGVPIATSDGLLPGVVCVIDHQPRLWTERDRAILRDLAATAAGELELRAVRRVQRDTERRYRDFVASSPEAIWRFEVDPPIDTSLPVEQQVEAMFHDARLAECNNALAQMYGYERAEDILGTRVGEMMPASEPGNVAYLTALVENGYRLSDVASVERDRAGRERHFVNSLVGVVDERGLVRAWGTQRDVTEAARTAAALERYRLLSKEGRDIILFLRPTDGRIVEANEAAVAAYGYDRDALLALSLSDLRAPETLHTLRESLTRANDEGLLSESVHRRRDGTTFPVEASARGADVGGERLVLAIVRDISERRAAEQERAELLTRAEQARAEAEQANRLKDEFLSTLSHELRTPLNAILGWTRMLQGPRLPDARREHALATIERNAHLQARLVDDILDMSRIVSGKLPLELEPVDPVAVVWAAVDSMRPTAEARGVHVQVSCDRDVGTVSADAGRVQQVVWNLLSNAVKFTPRGGRVTVRVRRVEEHVELEVADTGQGIAPEFLPHVFERFRQADAGRGRRHGGLGLGLAIVSHLVELHGGTVSARSEGVGHGATFVVRLPLIAMAAQTAGRWSDPGTPSVPPGEGAGALDHDPSLEGVHVLVVDDEVDARELLRSLLQSCGATVSTAADAAEAARLLRADRPDVMVSDIGMPGEDGLALIARVRAWAASEGGAIPAVALTAFARPEDRARAISAGFTAYLTKPVDLTLLLKTVARLLRGSMVS